jgi:hypothetical protein
MKKGSQMAYDEIKNIGYVSYDGNYGEQADLLMFDSNALTPQQWETLGEVNDNSRYEYVEAIFNGKDLSEWEQ